MKRLFLIMLSALLAFGAQAKVKGYKLEVVKEYRHDTNSYTQGLFFYKGSLYESTGQYGGTTFRKVDLSTGKALRKLEFSKKYFGEGSVMLDGRMYMLTWTNHVAFVYNAETLEYEKTYRYPREGWGLTTDGENLIASDGSSRIYFMDTEFRVDHTINVTLNGSPVKYLNELEWIDGKIWANVYTTDIIVIINPKTGVVEATVDCTGLLPKNMRTPDTDVLNGIAIDPVTRRIYLTGKNWPRLYEVRLVEKK